MYILSINEYVLSINEYVLSLLDLWLGAEIKSRCHPQCPIMFSPRSVDSSGADKQAGSWILQLVATKRPPMHKPEEGIIPVSQQGTLNHTLCVFTLDEDSVPSCCWDKAYVYHDETQ